MSAEGTARFQAVEQVREELMREGLPVLSPAAPALAALSLLEQLAEAAEEIAGGWSQRRQRELDRALAAVRSGRGA